MKKLTQFTFLLLASVPLSLAAQYYLEADGVLVIESESELTTSAFALETTVPGYKGDAYLRNIFELEGTGGFRKMSYPIRMANAGTYQLALRSRIGAGDDPTTANSSFIRLLDESGTPIEPVANQNVPANELWFEVHTTVLGAWNHESSNNEADPRSLAWQLEKGGKYTLEFSVRNRDHLVDRFILWNRGLHAFADTTTGKGTDETALDALLASSTGSGWVYDGDLTNPTDIFPLLDLVYNWQATRIVPHNNQGIIGWKHATFYTGVMELYRVNPDQKYIDFLTQISENNNWTMLEVNGDLWRHADNHLMGETFINLYLEDGETKPVRIAHVTEIFDRMLAQPWDGRRLYDWCDSLFMSPPVWAMMAALKNDDKYLDELSRLWWDSTDFLYHPEWNLYYRDSSYFNSVEANGKPTFWGRGNGWVVGGLVRLLDYMPQDYAGRGAFVDLFRDMSARLLSIQMASGGWPSSLLYPERYNFDTETSGTSFYVYGLAWGINNGILDRATYGPAVEKGWLEMNKYVTEEGGIQNIQTVGKEPGPVDTALDGREYGYGAFILAGIEMAEYYSASQGDSWLGYPVTEANGQRWADTTGFMGWLEITAAPYVYSQSLGGWAYIVETTDLQSGSWVYLFNN